MPRQPGGGADPTAPVRVYVLDDHELVRRGLKQLLDEHDGFTVVGESGSAREAARRIPALRPDVALLDLRLPDGTGTDVCRTVRAVDPTLKCLILTGYDDPQAPLEAAAAGACGYLLKEIQSPGLIQAIRAAAAGEKVFPPRLDKPDPGPPNRLSAREQRVLHLIGQGLSNREISTSMHLSEKTVKNHVSSILTKLDLHHRTQAALYTTHHQPGNTTNHNTDAQPGATGHRP